MRNLPVLLVLLGCDGSRPPEPTRAPPRAAVATFDATPAVAPTSPAPTPAPTQPMPMSPRLPTPTPAPRNGWLDLPAWKSGDRLALTWRVTQVLHSVDAESSKQPLELVATIDGVSRRITFPKQLGALSPLNQAVCDDPKTDHRIAYPLLAGEVAKITFYEGGAGGFVVRRSGRDALAVVGWFLTDGACVDKRGNFIECKRKEELVVRFHVPESVKIYEAIVEIDPNGIELPFDCQQDP